MMHRQEKPCYDDAVLYKPLIRRGVSTGCRKKPATAEEGYMAAFAIHGDIIWAERLGKLEYIENGYIVVDGSVIASVSSEKPQGIKVIDESHHLVIPGLSDLHLHAPQYPFMGMYMDEELLTWLEKHTFPEEAKYSDAAYAERAYTQFADDLKRSATVNVSVFGTIHTDATLMLMDKLEEAGIAGYAGKVSMDRNSPPSLTEETDRAVEEVRRFIEEGASHDLMKPIITPRFIPSCSDALLEALGRIAADRGLPVQSHLDENPSEVEWVKELCPWAGSYAEAYDHFSLLGQRSIMAHCVWMQESEIDLLSRRGSYVAHSPSSNLNLSSGIAPIRRCIDKDVNIGLATDVAGGSTLSIMRVVQDAVTSSKMRWRYISKDEKPLSFPEAFYLATKGGGSFFGRTGSFEPGYDADIAVLSEKRCSTVISSGLSPAERLELYAYRSPDEDVVAKFVKGKRII